MSKYGIKTKLECVEQVFNGAPIATVARMHGIPDGTVSYWCRMSGVGSKRSYWTVREKMRASEMWKNGCTCKEIAAELGKTDIAVKVFAQRNRHLMPTRGHGGARINSGRKKES